MRVRRRLALVVFAGLVLTLAAALTGAGWAATAAARAGIDNQLRHQSDAISDAADQFGPGMQAAPPPVPGNPPPLQQAGPDELPGQTPSGTTPTDDASSAGQQPSDETSTTASDDAQAVLDLIPFQVVNREREVVAGNHDLPIDESAIGAAFDTGRDQFRTVNIGGEQYRMLLHKESDDRVVQVVAPVESVGADLDNLYRNLLLAGLGGALVVAVLSALIAQRFTRPFAEVSRAAAAAGRTVGAIDNDPKHDEVDELSRNVDSLAAALEVALQQQERFVADASHELRTPLTSLRMKVEFLGQQPNLAGSAREEILAAAVLELETMTALVDELVDLARGNRINEPQTDTALSELAEAVAARARLSTGRTIEVDTDTTVARIRPEVVRRALTNLIANAHKYSPVAGAITVSQRGGRFEVGDSGPGIPQEERARVFDRFYRSPRDTDKPGSGIGLAIVKRAALVHGGQVWIEDRPAGGVVVGFSVTAADS